MPDEFLKRKPVTEAQVSAYHRLRRLQEQTRSNIPALTANRSMSSFTLHDEPLSEAAHGNVRVVVYPQDPFVGEAEVRSMSAADITHGLVNTRFRVEDSSTPVAQPDEEGNYMYWPGTAQFDQVNSFYYATFTLRMYERYARRALPWSFPSPRITIDPHVGNQANAFYNEQDRLLGFHSFQLDGETISTSQSADIVSHETAHAVLDGMRDLYNESFGLGTTAFHESFGDMTAMQVALHDDSLVRRLLDWTGGDLRLDNFVSAVAEQLTTALMRNGGDHLHAHTIYLRNALNSLKYEPFDKLEYSPKDPETVLGRQCHNYSRLFTGAYYDLLVGIYEQFKKTLPAHAAIYRARDELGYLLMGAIELGPVGEFTFADMARAFIAADQVLYEGHHQPVLIDVFHGRGLLSPTEAKHFIAELKSLPEIYLPDTINSALASALYLEETLIPQLKLNPDSELVPMGAYRNAAGHAHLTYFTSRKVLLEGEQFKQFNGASIDVFGGLTLKFDSDNRLRSVFYRPVNDEDVRQIKILTADLIQLGLIVDTLETGDLNFSELIPHGLYLHDPAPSNTITQAKLVKYPVSVDPIPRRLSDFVGYLRQVMMRAQ